jgi:hypothetical protein
MSGHGGGGERPPVNSIDCRAIVIKTSIVSPDPDVLATLNESDDLKIVLHSATGPLMALTDNNQVLGAVFTNSPTMLIQCINEGTDYIATILNIDGGECQILIKAL